MRLRSGQLLALGTALPLLLIIASLVAGAATIVHQNHVRYRLLDVVEPAGHAADQLVTAMVNQETGIRGYELTGRRVFLQPYALGQGEEAADLRELRSARVPGSAAALALSIGRIDAWEDKTALPALRRAHRQRQGTATTIDTSLAGKRRFDAIRAALATLQVRIHGQVTAAQRSLTSSARGTEVTLGIAGGVVLLTVIGVALALTGLLARPLARLSSATRRVAGGELEHPIGIDGPADVERLGADVEAMRVRLVGELAAATRARNTLQALTEELERSNRDLEQFAYVASHDLQEPLRKVTSFVQLLQERYRGKLDERADSYIAFAVDGAVRMQHLINDLLAFSRVGRSQVVRRRTDLTRLAAAAAADLEDAVRAAGATVEIGALPELDVVPSLIQTVFQNLIGNAIKFRGETDPHVRLDAVREEAEWHFACTDNGIGIEPQYAERVFVIFQRLHTRERYGGTGIGLAMCRKIVEFHGGRMWLDTAYQGGTRIEFRLPETPESATMET